MKKKLALTALCFLHGQHLSQSFMEVKEAAIYILSESFRHLFRSKVRFAHTLHRHFVDMDSFKSGCLAFCCDDFDLQVADPSPSFNQLFAFPNLLRFTELPKVSSILESVRTSIPREGSSWSCG